ncbi:transglutaminase-like domain-containing protein [Aureibacter tunicatorum]|uniref:Transglutaminase-like domain-containing protein n=1 Tax=Aureibacter tunicatorum TaxID=866807 RepID=A0AAE4BTN3_9BACT|nr:transglutaminase-like domain-containing protein [Aureibacter tunicatorum]MDR6239983.1 hypothetical protein [Aureibacter tunicatorum]BDD04455.1 hypothetical protein AUTU_19380 [Aureibacter tunicatorum]
MQAKAKRQIKSGGEYNHLIDSTNLQRSTITLEEKGDVFKTLMHIEKVAKEHREALILLAARLKGLNVKQTCRNIWNFVYHHIQYTEDHPLKEQLHTPQRIWDKRAEGVDCDDYTIFISCLLMNLGIKHSYRMTKYNGKDKFQHVYPIAYSEDGKEYYTMDCVVDDFDYEVPYSEVYDKDIMQIELLNGLDLAENLSDQEDDSMILSEFEGEEALKGIEFLGNIGGGTDWGEEFGLIDIDTLSGLNGTGELTPSQAYNGFWNGIKGHLINTRNKLVVNPSVFGEYGGNILTEVNYVLSVWDNPKERERAIETLADLPQRSDYSELEGLNGLDGWFKKAFKKISRPFKKVWKGVKKAAKSVGRGIRNVTRKVATTAKRVWKSTKELGGRVWKGVKKVGNFVWKGIKEVGKFLMKFNPLTALARKGVLTFITYNKTKPVQLGVARLSPQQVKEFGIDPSYHRKCVEAYKKSYNLFVNIMQGKRKNFDNAILKGWRMKAKNEDFFVNNLTYDPIRGASSKSTTADQKELKRLLESSMKKNKSLVKYHKKTKAKTRNKKRSSLRNKGGMRRFLSKVLSKTRFKPTVYRRPSRPTGRPVGRGSYVAKARRGYDRGLRGFENVDMEPEDFNVTLAGLGEPATAAASGAAASGFIAKLVGFFKGIGATVLKLFKKAKTALSKSKATNGLTKGSSGQGVTPGQKGIDLTKVNDWLDKGKKIVDTGKSIYDKGRQIVHTVAPPRKPSIIDSPTNPSYRPGGGFRPVVPYKPSVNLTPHIPQKSVPTNLTTKAEDKTAGGMNMLLVAGLAVAGVVVLGNSNGSKETEKKAA